MDLVKLLQVVILLGILLFAYFLPQIVDYYKDRNQQLKENKKSCKKDCCIKKIA